MAWRILCRLWAGILGLLLVQSAGAAPPDQLADALALPHASALVGARDVPLFAWVETEAGMRNVWIGGPGRTARQLTAFTEDDGQHISDLALSRDGSMLAFVRGGDEDMPNEGDLPNTAREVAPPRQAVAIVPTAGGAQVTIGDGHSPAFSPTGDRIAFARRGEIWLWAKGGQARRVASLPGRIARLGWSPDGRRLLIAEERGEHGFVVLLDLSEARLTYLDPGLGHSLDPTFSPDGREVAFIRSMAPPAGAAPDNGPYWSIRIVDTHTGKARTAWAAPAGQGGQYHGTRSRNLFWSEEGLLIFPWERTGWLHIHALDPLTGGEPRALTAGAFEVENFNLTPDGRFLLYAANTDERDRRHVWRRALRGGAPERLTGSAGIQSHPAVAANAVAVLATDASRPAYVALADRRLTPLGRSIEARGFAAPEPVVLRATDGFESRGQFFPARNCRRDCPAIVYVHGGPRRQMLLGFHPSAYYSRAYVMNQQLAAEGYHVLSVNYRGGTGYGHAFREAPETGREGASEYRDVLAAGRWLAARADVDDERIGIWGGSWGGYLTALALARDSDLFAAGVDFHGVHSLQRSVPISLSPEAQDKARQLQWTSSPLAAIERWRSPVLLVHGDDDRNVDFGQSLLLARELAARRIPYRELVFPNERHTFFRHQSWLESLRATEDFLERTLMKTSPLQ